MDYSLRQKVQNGSGAHPASYSMPTGVLSWGLSGRARPGRAGKLTLHLQLAPMLRMRRAIPLQTVHAFMASTIQPITLPVLSTAMVKQC